ncbi:XRE family transcriptional regulator [Chitinophaga lutea]|uniref:XRE family transcriptional regulator n=2 Tax=Chitinophaga lutea TaxID=2488634 RepID=A0A3N4QEC1_9BACT|nr:XRE family transcriptional regulator [Chitinophaga lutea]
MISRYERGLITPSLEVARKIAQVLKVSLDFLVFGMSEQTANQNVELKVHDVASLSDEDKAHVFAVIDAFVTKARLQKILQ